MRPTLLLTALPMLLLACHSQSSPDSPATAAARFSQQQPPWAAADTSFNLPVKGDTLLTTPHFRFIAHGSVDLGALRKVAEAGEEAWRQIVVFVGKKSELPPVAHHVYPSAEVKGLLLKNTAACHLDFEKTEAHTVLDPYAGGCFSSMENELLLRNLLGKPQVPALEHGLAIRFGQGWQRRGYAYWSARLAASGNLLPLAELLDPATWQEGGAPLQAWCLSASLTLFLEEKWGRQLFLQNYQDWQPTSAELDDLEPAWQQFMAQQAATFAPVFEKEKNAAAGGLPYLKGFNFTHEGYQIFNGYGSAEADRALDRLDSLGANAVSIVPYTFLRNPRQPARLPLMQRPGSENDEAVIHSAQHAKSHGMAVLLKPQIWMRDGKWPGDIGMDSEADWQAFFRHYNRWLVHYAILAETYGWDALCIGTEMVQTTLQRETDWRALIQQIRGMYNGKLTYAANWGDEFEQTTLWNDLDFIGLNCYYPLSQKDNPSDRELDRSLSDVMGKIEKVCGRYRKKLVFTEIGFPSVESPWKKPHEDWGDDLQFDAEGQRRCYEAVLRVIEGKQWCGGVLWWKCHSTPNKRRKRDTDFTPFGKDAEAVVRGWLGKR
ncbi:MAG: hypothetical protein GC192_22980 [Bacteroidetes bacterium]|nr:hypothetical protein [Bacteroidota bacterium]